jgi:hypothetical protein
MYDLGSATVSEPRHSLSTFLVFAMLPMLAGILLLYARTFESSFQTSSRLRLDVRLWLFLWILLKFGIVEGARITALIKRDANPQ